MIYLHIPEKVSKQEKEAVLNDPDIRVGVEFEIESEVSIIGTGLQNQYDERVENALVAVPLVDLPRLRNIERLVQDVEEYTGREEGDRWDRRDLYGLFLASEVLDWSDEQFYYVPILTRFDYIYLEVGSLSEIVTLVSSGLESVNSPWVSSTDVMKLNEWLDLRNRSVDSNPGSVVADLESIVDGDINVSDTYHGGASSSGWRIEPDSSLRSQNGFELISPKGGLPLKRMLSIIKDVFNYVYDSDSLSTSQNTGFHVNLSIEGVDLSEDLDRLKLALLMEEGKVFKFFQSRENNNYTASVLKALTTVKDPSLIFQGNKKKEYRQIVSGIKNEVLPQSKHYGINFAKIKKGNYVEFRYLGGPDYHTKYKRVRSQILDYAYFLRAATDPEMERREYLKKLYRLIDEIEEPLSKTKTIHDITTEILDRQADLTGRERDLDPKEDAVFLIKKAREAMKKDIFSNSKVQAEITSYITTYIYLIKRDYTSGKLTGERGVEYLKTFAEILDSSGLFDDFQRIWRHFLKSREIPDQLEVSLSELMP